MKRWDSQHSDPDHEFSVFIYDGSQKPFYSRSRPRHLVAPTITIAHGLGFKELLNLQLPKEWIMRCLNWGQIRCYAFTPTLPSLSLTTRDGSLRSSDRRPVGHLRLVFALHIFISCQLCLCLWRLYEKQSVLQHYAVSYRSWQKHRKSTNDIQQASPLYSLARSSRLLFPPPSLSGSTAFLVANIIHYCCLQPSYRQ